MYTVKRMKSESNEEILIESISRCSHFTAPASEVCFSKSMCGNYRQSFQAVWFKQSNFLHYDEANNVVFYHTCMIGIFQNKFKGINLLSKTTTKLFNLLQRIPILQKLSKATTKLFNYEEYPYYRIL